MKLLKEKIILIIEVGVLSFAAFIIGASLSLLTTHASSSTSPYIPLSNPVTWPLFLQDLHFGDRGSMVQELQIILNKDPRTQVAITGIGSPGEETNYYGSLTRQAVARFQAIYFPNQTLSSLVLDATTRQKLNSLIQPVVGTSTASANAISSSTGFQITNSIVLPVMKPIVAVATVIPRQVKPGAQITIIGKGFNGSNTVYIGTSTVVQASSADGYTIVLSTITSELAVGKYLVVVANINGSSSTTNPRGTHFVVSTNPVPAPQLIFASPTSASVNATITLTGQNFSSTNNTVYTAYGTIDNVVSKDGTHLVVPFNQLVQAITSLPAGQGFPPGSKVIIPIDVSTDGGYSPMPVKVTLNL